MKEFLPRKDRIILSAIDIINELGIQGLSTKELAFREGINESALYRHFKNKDEILKEVLEYFSQFDNAIFNSVVKKELPIKEKIIFFVKSYVEYYEGYPAITAIMVSLETFRHISAIKEQMEDICNKRINNLASLIGKHQEQGEINNLFTPKELSSIVFGFCTYRISEWRMSEFGFPLKESILETLDKMLQSIL